MENYVFHGEMEWDRNNNEDEEEVQTIFLNKENVVEGGEGGLAQGLHARAAHMSSALEEHAKYVVLRGNLMEHVMRNR